MNNTSYNVFIYKTRKVAGATKRPHNVRWRVVKEQFSEYYATAGLAKSFRAELERAVNQGEAFDTETGLPPSIQRKREEKEESAKRVTWLEHARSYAEYKWPNSAAKSRKGRADVLRDITFAVLPAPRKSEWRPDNVVLADALRRWAFISGRLDSTPDDQIPAAIVDALGWMEQNSPSIAEVAHVDSVRKVLDSLTRTQKGTIAAANYFMRRRTILYNVFRYAVTQGHIGANPLDAPDLHWERPNDLKTENVIDPRAVGHREQVEAMLTAVSYVGTAQGPRYVAYFASLYYAMLRPEEAANLKDTQCELPEAGWGRIVVDGAAPSVGRDWTDTGKPYELRGLKHRGRKATRDVPIPPRLVQLLRDHIGTYGIGPNGRIFRTVRGNPYTVKEGGRVWAKARAIGLSPADQKTPLLKHVYLLRASGISYRRAAGVPVKEVAEWAGHSPEVQERHYSRVLTGFEDRWKRRMDEFMND